MQNCSNYFFQSLLQICFQIFTFLCLQNRLKPLIVWCRNLLKYYKDLHWRSSSCGWIWWRKILVFVWGEPDIVRYLYNLLWTSSSSNFWRILAYFTMGQKKVFVKLNKTEFLHVSAHLRYFVVDPNRHVRGKFWKTEWQSGWPNQFCHLLWWPQ